MRYSTLLLAFLLCTFSLSAKDRLFYQIKVYHLKNDQQLQSLEQFLQSSYVPALHRSGIKQVGVFKPVTADTADLKLYVLIPFSNLEQLASLDNRLFQDKSFLESGKTFIDAAWNNPMYARVESILLQAFPGMPGMDIPKLESPRQERIYELRSYESSSEKYHINKVRMFNAGDEIGIFKRLGFNAVFYGSVVAGSRMPNLMYMTTFNNKAERDAHWKAFGDDSQWKSLVAKEEYAHNVSKSEIFFLQPTDYSDI
ncbi:NIPSNAP family containing protein [Chitinophaga silvatica]|uniref:NIPSNAP family containing protein n=1 Tax=Chitinophaga silvatica TaxID=2282649 RepID=A0A3E1Y8H4_9BACT|nr:NIPSNAP family protein [Chitinophaga silvatica]RFS21414.1 NIPSNAP family containing protein [Chitinophaga silvatica]